MPISLGKFYFSLWFKIFSLYFTFMNYKKEYTRHILRILLLAFFVISLIVELVGHIYSSWICKRVLMVGNDLQQHYLIWAGVWHQIITIVDGRLAP